MKEQYINPVIEIVEFETEDIITTSGLLGVSDFPEDDLGWGMIN
jgi:hypothetical protein